MKHTGSRIVKAVLALRVFGAKGRRTHMPVSLAKGYNDEWIAYPIGGDSGSIVRLSRSDGYIIIPENAMYFDEGEKVNVHLFTEQKLGSDMFFIGSHCPIAEILMEKLMEKYSIKIVNVGSMGGLLAVKRGEADVAGIHLYDPETKTYNKPYLKRYWLENKAAIIRGYDRELVFAFRKNIEFKKAEDFFTGRFRLANRVLGSGTRSYLDNLLYKTSLKLKIDPSKIPEIIPGYNTEYKTHHKVVRAIVEGRADVGLTLRYVAEQYGLKYKHVCWEKYDFVVRKNKLNKESVKHFISIIKDEKIKEMINSLAGYRIDENVGEIIYS